MSKVIRIEKVAEVTGLSRTTIWRKCKSGEFPARIQLGANSVGWLESEIRNWIESRNRIATGKPRQRDRRKAA